MGLEADTFLGSLFGSCPHLAPPHPSHPEIFDKLSGTDPKKPPVAAPAPLEATGKTRISGTSFGNPRCQGGGWGRSAGHAQ